MPILYTGLKHTFIVAMIYFYAMDTSKLYATFVGIGK